MKPKRVRHHTDDEGLESIRRMEGIKPARADEPFVAGVHVEIEPFGTTRPGLGGPIRDLSCVGEGSFVEFDAPLYLVRTRIGPRNTAMIPTAPDELFSLRGLNPVFVKVRFHFWEFWRRKPE